MATNNSVIESRIDADEAAAEAARLAMYAPEPEGSDTQGDDKGDLLNTEGEQGGDESAAPETAEAAGDEQKKDDSGVGEQPPELDPKKEASFEKKYLSLKGKYDKELPKAAADLKGVRAELKQWQAYAETLESKVKAAEDATKVAPVAEAKKDEEKVALDTNDPELQTLIADYPGVGKILSSMETERKKDKEKILALEALITSSGDKLKTIESDVVVSRSSRFESDMATLVGPDWRATDTDAGFMEFLQEEVSYTGKTRLQFLKAASAALDAQTVSKFFNDYRASLGDGSDAGAEGSEEDKGAAGGKAPGDKMRKFVAPPRSGGNPPGNRQAQDAVYTRAQYQKFIDDTIKGKYKPKEWGGKSEAEMDILFDKAIAANTLR